jgi:hypothetical protein
MTEIDRKMNSDAAELLRDAEARASEKSTERGLDQLAGQLERRERSGELLRPLERQEHFSPPVSDRVRSGELGLNQAAAGLERRQNSGLRIESGERSPENRGPARTLEHNGQVLSFAEVSGKFKRWNEGDTDAFLSRIEQVKGKPGFEHEHALCDLIANHPEKFGPFLEK